MSRRTVQDYQSLIDSFLKAVFQYLVRCTRLTEKHYMMLSLNINLHTVLKSGRVMEGAVRFS